jgi:uncharacterized delta-60 repeat protein
MKKKILFIALLILSQISYGQNATDVDTSFKTGKGFDGTVYEIAIQKDGKIIVGGSFGSYNGVSKNRIVRLNIDGTIDSAFKIGTGFSMGTISSIVIQSDGKIVIGNTYAGSYLQYNGDNIKSLIRLNNDGSIDRSFNFFLTEDFSIETLSVQSDGKIVYGGSAPGVYNNSNILGRVLSNGDRDRSFVFYNYYPSPMMVSTSTLSSDGKIYAGGVFNGVNNTSKSRGIARLNIDGSTDSSFKMGGGIDADLDLIYAFYRVSTLALQSDGKIIIGGRFGSFINNSSSINISYSGSNSIFRLNSNGSVDENFNKNKVGFNTDSYVNKILLQQDGKLLVGGNFASYNGVACNKFIRLNFDGTLDETFIIDSTFDNGTSASVQSLAVQSDKKILVGGWFATYNGISAKNLVRLIDKGTLSTEKFYKNDFNIFPNPVKEILDINKLDSESAIEYTIYDISGKQITSNLLQEYKIDVRFLSTGIYILKIKTDEKIFENKFIKE